MKLKDLLNEQETSSPQPGDRLQLVFSGGKLQHFLAVRGGNVIVDNKYHKKLPGRLAQLKDGKFDFYKPNFKVKVNNLKAIGTTRNGKTIWQIKDTKRAIDGRYDLKYKTLAPPRMFAYVEL